MKKYSLAEHREDAWLWFHETWKDSYKRDATEQRLMLIYYERWLNDRDLLTVEDGLKFEYRNYDDPCICENYHPMPGPHHEEGCPRRIVVPRPR